MDDLRVPESQVLGEVGEGFAPMQMRLTVRRLKWAPDALVWRNAL